MSTAPESAGTDVLQNLFHAFLWTIICVVCIGIAVMALLASSWWWANFPNWPPLYYPGIGLAAGFFFLEAMAVWNAHKSLSSAFN